MKAKIIATFVFLLTLFVSIHAQEKSGTGSYLLSHDSLLFDGANNSTYYSTGPCGCTIKILKMSGILSATYCEVKYGNVCGLKDTTVYIRKGKIVPTYITEILDGDSISTGDYDDCQVDLQLDDGKRIHMGRNVSMSMNKDHCKNPMSLILHYGLLLLDFTKGDKDKTISVKTERGEVINRGTIYSIEIAKDGDKTVDIVRVYEGSVEFKPNSQNKDYKQSNKDKDAAMKQLTADYKAGKISASEFSQKALEISKGVTDNVPKSVIVEAGFESRIVGFGNPTDPVQFDTSSDPGEIK